MKKLLFSCFMVLLVGLAGCDNEFPPCGPENVNEKYTVEHDTDYFGMPRDYYCHCDGEWQPAQEEEACDTTPVTINLGW